MLQGSWDVPDIGLMTGISTVIARAVIDHEIGDE